MKQLVRFLNDEEGGVAIEYTFLATLIAMAAIGAMSAIGTSLATTFGDAATALS